MFVLFLDVKLSRFQGFKIVLARRKRADENNATR